MADIGAVLFAVGWNARRNDVTPHCVSCGVTWKIRHSIKIPLVTQRTVAEQFPRSDDNRRSHVFRQRGD